MNENEKIFPFKVLYADGTRSWYALGGKEIWGVIVGKAAIALKAHQNPVTYMAARGLGRRAIFPANVKKCSAGSIIFWQDIVDMDDASRKLHQLNQFLEYLGGESLHGSYWTATDRFNIDRFTAYFVSFSQADEYGHYPENSLGFMDVFEAGKCFFRPVVLL